MRLRDLFCIILMLLLIVVPITAFGGAKNKDKVNYATALKDIRKSFERYEKAREEFREGIKADAAMKFNPDEFPDPFVYPSWLYNRDRNNDVAFLTTFKLTAITVQHGKNTKRWAMFEDNATQGHIVQEGDNIGPNGVVEKINDSSVDINLLVENSFGEKVEEIINIKLK